MTNKIVEHQFTGPTTPYANYDSNKTTLGTLMTQMTGSGLNQWVGPMPVGFIRMREMGGSGGAATDFIPNYPYAIQISTTIDWIFMASVETATTSRKVGLVVYDRSTQTFEFKGSIIMSLSGGNHTATGLRVVRYLYTTGTVEVSGTSVTGTDTAWKTARYASGARIGFGNTDPNEIINWFEISEITDDASIILRENAGTISSGASFVIDELRVIMSTISSVAILGGLFLVKGLNFSTFSTVGTLLSIASNEDNIQGVFWLKDAETSTNTISSGIGLDTDYTNSSHFCYVLNNNTTTTLSVYKYDIRAPLTSSTTTEAFLYKTGISGVLPTLLTLGNSRLATLQHGPAAGEKSIFFCTASRIFRIPVSSITGGSAGFVRDAMLDIPPGFATSMVGQTFNNVDNSEFLDRLITFSASPNRGCVTKYNIESYPIDHVFGCYTGQIDGSTAWPGYTTPHWNTGFATSTGYIEKGMAYIARTAGAIYTSALYAIPLGADWNYANVKNERVISPALDTPYAESLTRLYVNNDKIIGSHVLGTIPEPYRVFVRTTGIADNSGTWTRVEAGDLSSIVPAEQIQVMFEFRMLGLTCVPARIHSLAVVYETPSTDSHFQPSLKFANKNTPRFVWRFSEAFGEDVPALRVRIYDADSGSILFDDNTNDPTGIFEKTIDANTWTAWNDTDKENETTYVRYTYRPGNTTIVRSRLKAILSLS